MKKFLIILIIAAAGVGLAWYALGRTASEPQSAQPETAQQLAEPPLSLEERFAAAFYEADLPNLEEPAESPEITGDAAADAYIRELAEARGFRPQRLAVGPLEEIQGVTMQPAAAEGWLKLQTAARNNGIYLGLVSGHRSVENQRVIFQTQLQNRAIAEQGRGYSAAQITAGEADAIITAILREYSISGYSKHHTGYALDITDTARGESFEKFATSEGYKWISANEYANTRAYGFLPSYPEGVSDQGPRPEPWEYVWVGTQTAQNL